MWKAQRESKYVFLSRPRRFGKSLLPTTFASFFRGEKELFSGLKVMKLEKYWVAYPVIHLDLSIAKGAEDPDDLRDTLLYLLEDYTTIYGTNPAEKTPGKVLRGIIKRAYQKDKQQVVVIYPKRCDVVGRLPRKEGLPTLMRRAMCLNAAGRVPRRSGICASMQRDECLDAVGWGACSCGISASMSEWHSLR